MNALPVWLPPLITLDDYDSDWSLYVDAIYAIFWRDFVEAQPKLQGRWVRCRRDPLYDGKVAGFWHCIQEGADEEERTPDLRRCERIAWIRAVIENARQPDVDDWPNVRGSDKRRLLWYREEYLVVLADRMRQRDGFEYLQLITAYCTPAEHTRRKLRKERDEAAANG